MSTQTLPTTVVNANNLLTYLIARFGFISLFIILTVLLILVLRLLFLSKKQKSVLGKLISMAIIITFSIQIIANLVNNLGFLMPLTLPLPFIASGGLATITNMTLMGIILSVFKSGSIVKDGFEFSGKPKSKFLQIADGKIIIEIDLK